MKSMQKLVIALVLTATSPFLIAANKGDQPMRHDHTVGDGPTQSCISVAQQRDGGG